MSLLSGNGEIRLLLGEVNEAMGFSIVVSIEMATNIETQVSCFLFDSAGYFRRNRASFYLTGELHAQAIDDVETTIPTTKAPTHAGLCHVGVPITEYVRVTLAKKVIKFLSHHSRHASSRAGKVRYADFEE